MDRTHGPPRNGRRRLHQPNGVKIGTARLDQAGGGKEVQIRGKKVVHLMNQPRLNSDRGINQWT